jgi:hypothetical protein
MATTYVQLAQAPSVYAIPVYNASTTADIPINSVVTIDTANNLTNTIPYIAVAVPGTSTPKQCVGITCSTIPSLSTGKMTPLGLISQAVCYGAVNAASVVDNCTVPSYTGRIQAHTGTSPQVAVALAAGADGDTIPIMLAHAANV